MRALGWTAVALALALPVGAAAKPARHAAAGAPAADVAAAVAAPGRPADQVKLDAVRKPVEVLKFAGLKRGDMALDLFAGGGYYTEIMAKAVGPRGGVVAFEPANFMNDKSRAAWAALKARAPNTGVLATPLTAVSLPTAAFDFVMLHLNYHDVYWESAKFGFPRMDPDAFLRTVYDSMKPGATIAVIDHVASRGGDTRAVVDKLHRIDPAVIKADFARAGFVLDGESDLLRNPADDHTKLVFDPSIRGVTDRVVYRFRKPRK
jgi:predicted methyltransferase